MEYNKGQYMAINSNIRQDQTHRDKAMQNKKIQYQTRHDKLNTIQAQIRQDKTRQDNANQYNAI